MTLRRYLRDAPRGRDVAVLPDRSDTLMGSNEPIFEGLAAERQPGRHVWRDPDLEPPTEDVDVAGGRHHDHDGDRLADQADPDFAYRDRATNPEPWCEDRADPASWDDPAILDHPLEDAAPW